MLIQGTHQFDRAAIMAAAHLSASIYRYGAQSYRSALREALRAAWSQARVARTCFVLNGNKGDPAEAVSLTRQAMMIRMKDRMTETDFAEVARLDALAAEVRAAA